MPKKEPAPPSPSSAPFLFSPPPSLATPSPSSSPFLFSTAPQPPASASTPAVSTMPSPAAPSSSSPVRSPLPSAASLAEGVCEDLFVTYKPSNAEEIVSDPPVCELLLDDAECAWLHFKSNGGAKSHFLEVGFPFSTKCMFLLAGIEFLCSKLWFHLCNSPSYRTVSARLNIIMLRKPTKLR